MHLYAALCFLSLCLGVLGDPWPYTRRFTNASLPADEHDDEMPNMFIDWLRYLVFDSKMSLLCSLSTRGSIAHDTSGELANVFVNGTIPQYVTTFQELEHHVLHYNLTDNTTRLPPVVWDSIPSTDNISVAQEAAALFSHLNFMLDPTCVTDKTQFWYRQTDGRCNWLKAGQSTIGSTGYPRSRDWGQTTYADGISQPREGPNPREVSNAFFKVSPLVVARPKSRISKEL